MAAKKGFQGAASGQLQFAACTDCGTLFGEFGRNRGGRRCSYCVEKREAFRRAFWAKGYKKGGDNGG